MICFGMSNDTLVWRSVFSIIYLHLNAIKCLHSCTYELINDPFFSFTLHFFFIYCFISEISACLGGRVNPPPPSSTPYPVYRFVHLVDVPCTHGLVLVFMSKVYSNSPALGKAQIERCPSSSRILGLLSKAITVHSIVLSHHSDLAPVCALLFRTIFFSPPAHTNATRWSPGLVKNKNWSNFVVQHFRYRGPLRCPMQCRIFLVITKSRFSFTRLSVGSYHAFALSFLAPLKSHHVRQLNNYAVKMRDVTRSRQAEPVPLPRLSDDCFTT